MARSRYRTDRRWGRRATTKLVSPVAPRASPSVAAQALTFPAIDWMLSRLVARPRVLQLAGILLGMLIVGLALRSLVPAAPLQPAGARAAAAQALVTASPPTPAGSDTQAAIDLVAAYN